MIYSSRTVDVPLPGFGNAPISTRFSVLNANGHVVIQTPYLPGNLSDSDAELFLTQYGEPV